MTLFAAFRALSSRSRPNRAAETECDRNVLSHPRICRDFVEGLNDTKFGPNIGARLISRRVSGAVMELPQHPHRWGRMTR
jgi:hypothetical protein